MKIKLVQTLVDIVELPQTVKCEIDRASNKYDHKQVKTLKIPKFKGYQPLVEGILGYLSNNFGGMSMFSGNVDNNADDSEGEYCPPQSSNLVFEIRDNKLYLYKESTIIIIDNNDHK